MEKKQTINESLGFWLYRSHAQVSAALRQTFQDAGYDLTPEQWAVLFRVQEQEGINQIQLSEKTFKDRHNITRILKQLDKRGYIEKRNDENDKRANRIYLSPSGRSLYKNIKPLVLQHRKRICKGFNAKDMLNIRKYLGQVIHNLNNQ
ncbi:MAG: MarR family transcriptional regulator [Smithella sp.]|jgi:DNA-binding MarR family transcriptional regulator